MQTIELEALLKRALDLLDRPAPAIHHVRMAARCTHAALRIVEAIDAEDSLPYGGELSPERSR